MIDHDHKGIKASGKGEVGDQTTGDLLEGAGAGGRNGLEWGSGRMGVDLVLLARCASADITADVRGEAWPPKLRGDQLASFENARMASSGMIMMPCHDRAAQVSICGDIDAVLVSQNASVVMPVRKVGVESSRDSTWESMEGVKDQWVRSRGGAELVGEGGIDEVDKEFVREQGDRLIVRIGCGDMIRSTRQGIGSTEIFAWDVFERQVKLREVKQPSGLAAIQITRLAEVS